MGRSTWKEENAPTPTLSTSLPLGSVIIEEGRLKWWNGKVGISERGWEWWVEGSVCKRELVRESRLKKGESEQRARKCIIQREGGERLLQVHDFYHILLLLTRPFRRDLGFPCRYTLPVQEHKGAAIAKCSLLVNCMCSIFLLQV